MRPTQLTIPQPCAQSWAAMTPTATGRHCAACQKTVVDFTLMADAEILAHLARAVGETCGRFRSSQLGRPLQPLVVPAPARWRAWLTALAAVWSLREGGSLVAVAQQPTEQRSAPAAPPDLQFKRRDDYEGSRATQFVLEGFVIEANGQQAVPGARVTLKNTSLGTVTDIDGHFSLPIPTDYAAQSVEVEFNFVGYVPEVRRFAWQEPGTLQCRIKLEESRMGLNEVVVTNLSLPALPPAPWHPRRFYYWGKYWLTRPFRRS
jgi:hypothetical protein